MNTSISTDRLSRRKLLRAGAVGLAGLHLASESGWAFQEQAVQPVKMTTTKIKGDLYEIEGGGGNVAMLATSQGVIIVDSKNYGDRFYEALVTQIKTVTDKPVKYLLNSHYHADHIGGNAQFAPTAQIVQHANARKCIVHRVETRRPPAPQPPQGVPAHYDFTTEASIYLGGQEVLMRHFGPGHTNGDSFIFFPAERILHTGDMMSNIGSTFGPLVDYDGGGTLVNYTKVLDEVLKLDFDIVIPGHGPVTDKAGLMVHRSNVEKFRNRVWSLIHEGKGPEEVTRIIGEEYKWAPNNLNMWWTVPGMLKELA
jgi:glyoxylase-like metal-dependent hydrolase (beta-lactamase superfamily II)